MHPLLKNELSLRVYGLDHLKGVDAPGRVLLEPLEPPGRDADHDARCPTRGRRRPPSARRATTSSTCGGARRSPRSCTAAFPIDRSRGGRGAIDKARELVERRLVHRRVPRGHALAGRAHAAVPPRRRRGSRSSSACRGADRDPRRVPGDAEGQVLAAGRPPARHAPLRRADRTRRGRDPPGAVAPDAAGGGAALRRGPHDLVGRRCSERSAARRPRSPARRARLGRTWEGTRPVPRAGEPRTWE